jgi:GNAT superfamily N-acetyltransferase
VTLIRPVVPADKDQWLVLWKGYLDFYREPLSDEITEHTFGRLCDDDQAMFGLVAEQAGHLVGIVNALFHLSTWSSSSYCYLEDLFVEPTARGGSVARQLIASVAERAGELGADKVYWHTQEFNGPARSLYDQLARRVSLVVYEIEL